MLLSNQFTSCFCVTMKFCVTLLLSLVLISFNIQAENKASLPVSWSGNFQYDFTSLNAENDETLSRGLLTINAESDLSNYLGNGALFSVDLALQRGSEPAFLGDVQVFSNLDSDNFSRLYEIFLQFNPTGNGTLKIGQLDANSDFAGPEYAGEFLNSSMGFSPTIPLPSYPETALGVNYAHQLNDHTELKLGIYESLERVNTFDEQIYLAQVNLTELANFSVGIGHWYDTALKHGEPYIVVEYQASPDIFASFQYGFGEADTVGLDYHTGLSVSLLNVVFANDVFGVGYSWVSASDRFESASELYYGFPVNENVSLKIDLQYINNPGLSDDVDNALASTLRLEMQF